MKLKGSINRLKGVEANVGNAISFLQVQDGMLESAGKIVDRMAIKVVESGCFEKQFRHELQF